MKKVCLDAGHGGIKPGAGFKDLLEKDVVLKIVLRAGEILESRGYEIVFTRTSDVNVELMTRCRIANEAKCDIFVSVHCNADPDEDLPNMPEAKGEEIWIYEGSKNGEKLAKAMEEEVNSFFPDEPFRGIKGSSGLAVLKYTDMPAVLLEVGFIDNSKTNASLRDNGVLELISKLIVKGISDYFA